MGPSEHAQMLEIFLFYLYGLLTARDTNSRILNMVTFFTRCGQAGYFRTPMEVMMSQVLESRDFLNIAAAVVTANAEGRPFEIFEMGRRYRYGLDEPARPSPNLQSKDAIMFARAYIDDPGKIDEYMKDNQVVFQSGDWRSHLITLLTTGNQIWKSPLAASIGNLLMMSLSMMCYGKVNGGFNHATFDEVKKRFGFDAVNDAYSFLVKLASAMSLVIDKGWMFFEGSSFDDLFEPDRLSGFLVDLSLMETAASRISNLRPIEGINLDNIRPKFKTLEADYRRIITTLSQHGSKRDKELLSSLKIRMTNLGNSITCHFYGMGNKAEPYALLFYGGSSLGKTTLCEYVSRVAFKLYGVPYDPTLVYSRNFKGKHWDGYTSGTIVTILDELASQRVAAGQVDETLAEFLNLVNTSRYVLSMASLTDKGLPFDSKVIIATTNTKNLNVAASFNSPQAFMRRFKCIVTVEVKPEYSKNPEADGFVRMLCPDKTRDMRRTNNLRDDDLDDAWIFKVEKIIIVRDGKEGQATYKYETILKTSSIYQFIAFVGKDMRNHKNHQELRMDRIDKMGGETCETCFCPKLRCTCVAPQPGEDGFIGPLLPPLPGESDFIGPVLPKPPPRRRRRQQDDTSSASSSSSDVQQQSGDQHMSLRDLFVICCCGFTLYHLCRVLVLVTSQITTYWRLLCARYWVVYRLTRFCDSLLQRLLYHYDVTVRRRDRFAARVRVWQSYRPMVQYTAYAVVLVGVLKLFHHYIIRVKPVINGGDTSCLNRDDLAAMNMIGRPASQWSRDGTHKGSLSTLSRTASQTVYGRIMANTGIFITSGKDLGTVRHFHTLCLGGDLYMCNSHSLNDLVFKDGYKKFTLNMPNQQISAEVRIEERLITRDRQRDIALITIPNLRPMVSLGYSVGQLGFDHGKSPFADERAVKTVKNNRSFYVMYRNYKSGPIVEAPEVMHESRVSATRMSLFGDPVDVMKVNFAKDETVTGDCGAPLLAYFPDGKGEDSLIAMIGIHVALEGRSNYVSIALSTEYISDLVGSHCSRLQSMDEKLIQTVSGGCGITLQSASLLEEDLDLDLERFGRTLIDGHPKSTPQFTPHERTYEFLGSIGNSDGTRYFRANHESKVSTTPFREESIEFFGDCGKGKPDTRSWLPKFMGLVQIVPNLVVFSTILVTTAAQGYLNHVSAFICRSARCLKPMPVDENLNGWPDVVHMNRVNMKTGGGFGFNAKKWRLCSFMEDLRFGIRYTLNDEVTDDVNYIENKYNEGRRAYPVFNANFKDEPVSFKKILEGRTRIIAACNFSFLMVTRAVFLPFVVFMQQNNLEFETAIGINADGPQWTDLVNHLLGSSRGEYEVRRHRVIAGDFKGWDRTVLNSLFMVTAFRVLITMVLATGQYLPRHVKIMWGVATDICYAVWDYFGDMLIFNGSNPSGQGLTVIINSIVNSIIMRYFYIVLWARSQSKTLCHLSYSEMREAMDSYEQHVIFVSYGDDNIATSTSDFFTFANISAVAAEHNIEYTDPEKKGFLYDFMDIEDATFLKRAFVKPEYSNFWYAPLDKEVIAKMSQVYVPGDLPKKEHLQEILKAKDRFAYKHGRSYHSSVRNFIRTQCEKYDLVDITQDLPTFEGYHFDDFEEAI
jgi:hypothetical protein